jgi:hypothetical protein
LLFIGILNFIFKIDGDNRTFGHRSKEKLPSIALTRWNYNRLLETVQNHKTDIENLFATIIENGSDWTQKPYVLPVAAWHF